MDEIINIAQEMGLDPQKIKFTKGNTSYSELFDTLFVGADVLPTMVNAAKANSRISLRGALGHEILGHREAFLAGRSRNARSVLDEVQASVRAARLTPNLSGAERITLLRDAAERLREAGIRWRDVGHLLFLE